MRRRDFALLTAAAVAGESTRAHAAWPADRPIQVFVPGPAGGGMDTFVRALLPFVQRQLPGAIFVIQNRTAAGGQLAFESVAQGAPDGYTIGAAQAPNALTLPIERTTRYKVEDFAFLGNVVEDPGGLFVRADSPLQGVADLVAAARRRPGEVTIGTAGIGSDDHLLVLALQEASGTSFSHVPYNGTPPIVAGLLAGDIAVGSFNMSEGLALLREGTLRALAQGGPSRWEGTPGVPTFRDQGFDVLGGSTRGIVAPVALPAEMRDRLAAAFAAGMADPGWRREAERLNLPLRIMSAEDQRSFFLAESARLHSLWQRRPWRD